jgi:hypothetical protein
MVRFGYFVCACVDSIYQQSREFVKRQHLENLEAVGKRQRVGNSMKREAIQD